MDRKLTFAKHTNNIKQKCLKLLNILKCLSYKKWALKTSQQIVVYKALIRSCMEYAPPVLLQSRNNISTLQIIQNKALRIILKVPYRTATSDLHTRTGVEMMDTRIKRLNSNYWKNCVRYNNEFNNEARPPKCD